MLGPGKTGRKLPNKPIIMNRKPIIKSKRSIKIIFSIFEN
jgi:hypothetical protein